MWKENQGLEIPCCVGADSVWRSEVDGTWKELEDVDFFDGYAEILLDHFCDLFVSGNAACLDLLLSSFTGSNPML